MRAVRWSTQFAKDYKRIFKRGKDISKLDQAIRAIAEGAPLPQKMRDHALVGNLAGCRECHLEPDWLLVYRVDEENVEFVRTGSHADLFR